MRPYSANELASSFCWGKDLSLLINKEARTHPRPVPLRKQRSDASHRPSLVLANQLLAAYHPIEGESYRS